MPDLPVRPSGSEAMDRGDLDGIAKALAEWSSLKPWEAIAEKLDCFIDDVPCAILICVPCSLGKAWGSREND